MCWCCSRRREPSFDYDEMNDMEFDYLLTSNASLRRKNRFWSRVARLFSTKQDRYTPIPTYGSSLDILQGQDSAETAQLLSQDQISKLYSKQPTPFEIFINPSSPTESASSVQNENNVSKNSFANIRPLEENEDFDSQKEFEPKLEIKLENIKQN
jgi:hypothetical protein